MDFKAQAVQIQLQAKDLRKSEFISLKLEVLNPVSLHFTLDTSLSFDHLKIVLVLASVQTLESDNSPMFKAPSCPETEFFVGNISILGPFTSLCPSDRLSFSIIFLLFVKFGI